MSLDANYVKLEQAVAKRLQFSKLYFDDRDIKDPDSGATKTVRTLAGVVTYEDGVAVSKTFSSTSSKLSSQLARFIVDPELEKKIFVITKVGSGYTTHYGLQIL